MIHKHPLRPDRLRQISASFSWVDHRLVHHDYLRQADPRAWGLYLFLVTLGGLSTQIQGGTPIRGSVGGRLRGDGLP